MFAISRPRKALLEAADSSLCVGFRPDTTQLPCNENPPNPCHNAPWWDLANAAHGHEYELDRYEQNGTTLLKQVKTTWSAVCPPAVSGDGNWNGNLVSELDHSNPMGVCDIQQTQVDTYTYDGSSSTSAPHQSVAFVYDSYGRATSRTTTVNDGSANGSPTTIVAKTAYTFDDNVSLVLGHRRPEPMRGGGPHPALEQHHDGDLQGLLRRARPPRGDALAGAQQPGRGHVLVLRSLAAAGLQVPYFVTAYTGGPGSAAYSIPDSTQAGTSYAYDGLGRQTSRTDALSNLRCQ